MPVFQDRRAGGRAGRIVGERSSLRSPRIGLTRLRCARRSTSPAGPWPTVDKVLAHVMEHGIHVAGGDKIGKTIIFAANRHHAMFIEERFNVGWPNYGGTFARRIVHGDSCSQSLIEAFEIPGKEPQIAISVDMMDTGIDVPEVVNLVFFKLVRSKT